MAERRPLVLVTGTLSELPTGDTLAGTLEQITQEVPTGALNGVNTTFVLANTPVAGSEHVFVDGILQSAAEGDYSITGDTITMDVAPASTQPVSVTYLLSGGVGGGSSPITKYTVTSAHCENTTSEVDVFSCSIPGGDWADGEHIEMAFHEEFTITGGANLVTKIKYGADEITVISASPASNSFGALQKFFLIRMGSDIYFTFDEGLNNNSPNLNYATYPQTFTPSNFSATKDLKITAQWDTAHTSNKYNITAGRALKA